MIGIECFFIHNHLKNQLIIEIEEIEESRWSLIDKGFLVADEFDIALPGKFFIGHLTGDGDAAFPVGRRNRAQVGQLLVVDIEDGSGNVLERSRVAADTCGAGVGDMVLLTTGSAARLSAGTGTLPVDVAIIAVVDHVELARPATKTSSSKKRKT